MRLSQICIAITQLARGGGAWSPLSLWPDGIATPGMWISPRDLTSQWQDYTGTTPVAVPGTVADTSNPVGLARDIRAGAPEVLGPELVVNGDFSDGASWSKQGNWTVSGGSAHSGNPSSGLIYSFPTIPFIEGALYAVTVESSGGQAWVSAGGRYHILTFPPGTNTKYVTGWGGSPYPWVGIEAENDVSVANISVKEIPGNHMLQSTSAARPLMSARVNLLTYTEDFSNAYWFTQNLTRVDDAAMAPDGSLTDLFYPTSSGVQRRILVSTIVPVGAAASQSIYVKSAGKAWVFLNAVNAASGADSCWFDISTGVVGTVGANATGATISPEGDGWWRISASGFGGAANNFYLCLVDADGSESVTASGTDGVYLWHPQLNLGSLADYQSVPGDGSTYATDFPIVQKYDGVDDGMATAAFTAGALINGMDCMIPVRRDSAAACVAGLYNGIADATKFFGMAESASGSGCVGSGAGTPTVWVDNAQLTGGTAVTRGTLHTALTVGDYHILEFRGLDLSAWTAAGFGLYTSYVFPGARGDIMLYPSTDSTADKDAARQYLADYYGVTLP